MRPWAAPISTMPRYMRKKNTSKICDSAKASTTMPANFVSVMPERTYEEGRNNKIFE